MAADAVYMAAHFLLDMDSPASGELASWLLQRFSDSPKAKFFFVLTAPEEYTILTRTMTEREILPPFGRWTGGETEGKLPFASPVRGYITRDSAESAGMIFLNAAGQPVSNGNYAWDRRTGRIYHVYEIWFDF
jgi:hypothetical protein